MDVYECHRVIHLYVRSRSEVGVQVSSECAYSTSFISPHVALSASVVPPWSTLQGAETLTAGGGNMWAALNPSADTPLTCGS